MNLNIKEKDGSEIPMDSFEKIPENSFSPMTQPISQSNKSIPKQYAKMVRPNIPPQKSQISYDDILSNMGMFVQQGQLHLIEDYPQIYNQVKQKNNTYVPKQNENASTKKVVKIQNNIPQNNIPQNNIPQNSYIYNKYFKDQLNTEPIVRKPTNLIEYRDMLIQNIIQKKRIQQIKSKKLLMPTNNIHMAPTNTSNLDKLFNFSQR